MNTIVLIKRIEKYGFRNSGERKFPQAYEIIETFGNAFVGRPYDTHRYQLIFEGPEGRVHDLFNLRNKKVSLSEDRFREIFPNVLKRHDFEKCRLYIIKKGRQRFAIVYTESEVPGTYQYHNIYVIRKSEVISFALFGIQILPDRQFKVGKDGELLSLPLDKK